MVLASLFVLSAQQTLGNWIVVAVSLLINQDLLHKFLITGFNANIAIAVLEECGAGGHSNLRKFKSAIHSLGSRRQKVAFSPFDTETRHIKRSTAHMMLTASFHFFTLSWLPVHNFYHLILWISCLNNLPSLAVQACDKLDASAGHRSERCYVRTASRIMWAVLSVLTVHPAPESKWKKCNFLSIHKPCSILTLRHGPRNQ